ncbi:hypothetical protein NC796_08460 [Aliifodinibius sp. S!AR15-10]|uniref:hypothetical protein n=1 Tax=Aliifodinibius sp. S!AR15-10 TaxID=2950437 RepID=UPI00286716C2|nr:hypothetical protein [Aliifodinibius sp. S!AR15-10]MDR8391166.1 hypothetical protein [Aliifodinibius sp. S!AR15-10]
MNICYLYTRKLFFFISLFLFPTALSAQTPVLKVDLDQFGRPESEVNKLGYQYWPINEASEHSRTFDGVKITFKHTGNAGTGLASNWYKVGIQDPNYAQLVNDGVTVQEGNDGGKIKMTISGLPPGEHTLLTFHNNIHNPETNTFSPIDIYVDGELQVDNLEPSTRSLEDIKGTTAYLHVTAEKGQDNTIVFAPDPASTASVKNVIVNGFELNTPNQKRQSRLPVPTNGNEHVQADEGAFTLNWSPAVDADSHDVYFGTDSSAVASAGRSSLMYKGNLQDTTFQVDNLYSMLTYYWRVDEVSGGTRTKGDIWSFRTAQLAFPGAQGYGRFARGGRGGKVVKVTNLNDNGPGSLREAVNKDIGPRTIVFDVSGMIKLDSTLNVDKPYITVAGQTAPGKGIAVRNATFGVTGNDVIVRFMRVRLGADNVAYGGMGLTGNNHSIIDHSSISWTMDEAFSSRGAKNITLQRTLISEALNVAGHDKYPPGTAHGYAASIGGSIGSFHHNLLVHNYGRNWSMAGGVNGNGRYIGKLDIRNNVVYNWGTRTTDGGAHEVNFVNNYYKPGPGTTVFHALKADHENYGGGKQQYYMKGNVMPGQFGVNNQEKGQKVAGKEVGYETFVDHRFFKPHVNTQSARDAYKKVLSDVGANQPQLDQQDKRMIRETLNGTYSAKGSVSGKKGFPDHEKDVGGYETYPEVYREKHWDSDDDGLPNWWEIIKGLNPNSAPGDFSDPNADEDRDGFTNLDWYLAWMAEPHYSSKHGEPIEIDLESLSRGYTEDPEFTISEVENGRVEVNNGKALFTPEERGLGSFSFTVTDEAGSSMTRKVNIVSNYNVEF